MTPRWTILAMLTALALVAAACGGGDGGGGGGEAEISGEVEGSVFAFGFGYETGDIIAQTRVDSFREEFPDVDLTFSESGFEEQPFLSALASDEPPDVVNIPRNVLGTYIARGVLEPMDQCLEQEGIDLGAYYDAAVAQVSSDGTAYAIPEFFNSRVWILNDTMFEEAGIDPAELDVSDWDAIADANEQLTQMDGGSLDAIGMDPKLPEFLPLWAWANDSPMISDDGTQVQLDQPGVAEALEFAASMHEPAGGRTTFLDFRDTWDFFGAENQYANDQLGGMPMEQWYLNVLGEASPDVPITVRAFETRGGDPITWSDGNSWAIPTASANPTAACAFARVMTEQETWVEAAEARAEERAANDQPNIGVYTGNQEADEVIFGEIVDLSEWPHLEEAVAVVRDVQESAFGLPPSPAAAQFENAWTDAVDAVMTGGEDAEQALQQAQQQAQEAIDAAEVP